MHGGLLPKHFFILITYVIIVGCNNLWIITPWRLEYVLFVFVFLLKSQVGATLHFQSSSFPEASEDALARQFNIYWTELKEIKWTKYLYMVSPTWHINNLPPIVSVIFQLWRGNQLQDHFSVIPVGIKIACDFISSMQWTKKNYCFFYFVTLVSPQ